MAAGFIKGITIEFSADADKLNQALKQTQTTLSRTQSELKAVNSSLKFQPRNTTLLQQKFDLLKKAVSDTKSKLDGLEKLQAQMKADGVSEDTAEFRQLEREIEKTKDQLKQAEKAVTEFGSVSKQKVMAVGQSFKDVGQKMSSIGQTLSTKVTAPLVAGFTVSAKYASDYEENLNKIDVAFGKNADSVKTWAQTASQQFGLSQVQATEAASAFGALGKGIGLSDSEAATMATTLSGLSADLGSYFNVGVDESAKALEGIFTGESEALKKFGVVMTDTNLKQFAADQGLVWEEMSQSEKTALRYSFVLDKTKDAQGDFARTSDGTANSLKQFQASLQDLGTSIGTVLLPMITPIIQKITELVLKFNELSPTAQKIITVIGIIVAAIGPLLIVIGSLISAVGTIISVAPAVGAAFSAMLGPIGLIIAAIAAAIAIGIAIYKNWDTIKAKAKAIWGTIKATVTRIVTTIVSNVTAKFVALKNKVNEIWNNIKTSITDKIQAAKDKVKAIIDKIKNFFPIKLKKIVSFMLPKINIGSKSTKVGDKNVKSPTFNVGGWHHYAKAATNPYMFSKPTGIVVGDAGQDEILYGRRSLMEDIASVVGGVGGDMIVNVYGSDNMSVNDLANAVEQKLINMQKRRTQAWA